RNQILSTERSSKRELLLPAHNKLPVTNDTLSLFTIPNITKSRAQHTLVSAHHSLTLLFLVSYTLQIMGLLG
ncbi:hypothetical protein VIGAN_01234000, partial [Vigna angularis var. angularis]